MRKIVSFDFDGTLHTDVRGTCPLDFDDPKPTPNKPVIARLREESKTNDIIIVTHRDEMDLDAVKAFVKWQKLPVKKIIATRGSKVSELEAAGAIRHYDDSLVVIKDFADNQPEGIELIVVWFDDMLPAKPPKYTNPFGLSSLFSDDDEDDDEYFDEEYQKK